MTEALPIDALPTDLLFHIMSLYANFQLKEFFNLRLVCRRFRDVAVTEWHTFDFSSTLQCSHFLTDDRFLRLISRCKNLQFVNLANCYQLTVKSLRALAGSPHIQYLGLNYMSQFTDRDLLWLHKLTELKSLHLYGCNVSAPLLMTIAKHCRQLQFLDLTSNRFPLTAALEALPPLCPDLRDLRVAGVQEVRDTLLLGLAEHCKRLTHIDIGHAKVTDHGVQTLVGACHDLESLSCPFCPLGDDTLAALAQCHNLKTLSLGHCLHPTRPFTMPTLVRVLRANPTLETLNLADAGGLSLEDLMLHWNRDQPPTAPSPLAKLRTLILPAKPVDPTAVERLIWAAPEIQLCILGDEDQSKRLPGLSRLCNILL
ncbi:hypothetical protein PAPYR_228 [Paratrimastix pyriformis]|uniref:F-box domain-containing protein n=1 Tax=Paratrimastix pyriformis TaxID=342808 RepID=A0ABQ8UZ02_9EUKA|nr:hypothetical protein PAPYR_228 [Paratrimastix pyriformis]